MFKFAALLPMMFLIISTQPVPHAIKSVKSVVMTASPSFTMAVNIDEQRANGADQSLMAFENALCSCDR